MGKPCAGIVIKDAIADITLQQVLTRPEDFDRYRYTKFEWRLPERRTRRASGRNRHRNRRKYQLHHRPRRFRSYAPATAPKYANQDKVNPGSVILPVK